MSFYGYTPVANDYSYVAKAGEGFGKAAAGVVGAVGGAMQKKAFNTAYKTLEEEKLAEAEAVFGGDKSAAAAAFKRHYYQMNGETPEQFNARRAKMDEGFERALTKQRHKQGANELRPQMDAISSYVPGGAVRADAPQGGQALTMPSGTQTWSERLRNLSPFNSDGTIQPGSADEVTNAQFGPQNGLGAKRPGVRAMNTDDTQQLQAQAGVTPEQTGGWKAQQGEFTDRPWSERLYTLNRFMDNDDIDEKTYKRYMEGLNAEQADKKAKETAAAALAKVEQQQRHDMDIEKYKQEQQTERNNATNASRERAAAKGRGGRGSDKSITETAAEGKIGEDKRSLASLREKILSEYKVAKTAKDKYGDADTDKQEAAKNTADKLIKEYIKKSAELEKRVKDYQKKFQNIQSYEHNEDEIRERFKFD